MISYTLQTNLDCVLNEFMILKDRRLIVGIIDPLTLVGLGVVSLVIIGTTVATSLIRTNTEYRSAAYGDKCSSRDSKPECTNGGCMDAHTSCRWVAAREECVKKEDSSCGGSSGGGGTAPTTAPSTGFYTNGYRDCAKISATAGYYVDKCINGNYCLSASLKASASCAYGDYVNGQKHQLANCWQGFQNIPCSSSTTPPATNPAVPTNTPKPVASTKPQPTATPVPCKFPNQCIQTTSVCYKPATGSCGSAFYRCCNTSAPTNTPLPTVTKVPTVRPTYTKTPIQSSPTPSKTRTPTPTRTKTPVPTAQPGTLDVGGYCGNDTAKCKPGLVCNSVCIKPIPTPTLNCPVACSPTAQACKGTTISSSSLRLCCDTLGCTPIPTLPRYIVASITKIPIPTTTKQLSPTSPPPPLCPAGTYHCLGNTLPIRLEQCVNSWNTATNRSEAHWVFLKYCSTCTNGSSTCSTYIPPTKIPTTIPTKPPSPTQPSSTYCPTNGLTRCANNNQDVETCISHRWYLPRPCNAGCQSIHVGGGATIAQCKPTPTPTVYGGNYAPINVTTQPRATATPTPTSRPTSVPTLIPSPVGYGGNYAPSINPSVPPRIVTPPTQLACLPDNTRCTNDNKNIPCCSGRACEWVKNKGSFCPGCLETGRPIESNACCSKITNWFGQCCRVGEINRSGFCSPSTTTPTAQPSPRPSITRSPSPYPTSPSCIPGFKCTNNQLIECKQVYDNRGFVVSKQEIFHPACVSPNLCSSEERKCISPTPKPSYTPTKTPKPTSTHTPKPTVTPTLKPLPQEPSPPTQSCTQSFINNIIMDNEYLDICNVDEKLPGSNNNCKYGGNTYYCCDGKKGKKITYINNSSGVCTKVCIDKSESYQACTYSITPPVNSPTPVSCAAAQANGQCNKKPTDRDDYDNSFTLCANNTLICCSNNVTPYFSDTIRKYTCQPPTQPISQVPPPTPSGNFVYYSQTDPRWAEVPVTYDNKGNLADSGCGQTVAAMLIATYSDSTVTPETIANTRPFPQGTEGSNYGQNIAYLNSLGFTSEMFYGFTEDMYKSLAAGWSDIWINGEYNGLPHHAVITDWHTANSVVHYTVQDPYFGPNMDCTAIPDSLDLTCTNSEGTEYNVTDLSKILLKPPA